MFYREIIGIETQRGPSFADITETVVKVVRNSGIMDGLCNIFVTSTTAGIMINEGDRFLMEDFKRLSRELVDENRIYSHTENAFSHLRAAFFGADRTVPVASGKIVMGKWQSILLCEFDIVARKRQVIITVLGEVPE